MDECDIDELPSDEIESLDPQMPPVTEDNSRVNRYIRQISCGTSVLAPLSSIFFIGMASGAAGGLLLGTTAVVMLQSLELLADNRPLMDHLEKRMAYIYHLFESKEQVHDIWISVSAVMFGILSATLSLAVGISIGLSTYSLEIKRKGEAEMGKALAVAGPVCLMVVTGTGYIMGFTLESCLSITLDNIGWLIMIATVLFVTCPIIILILVDPIIVFLILEISLTLYIAYHIFTICHLVRMRVILATFCVPLPFMFSSLQKSHSLKLHIATVRLMLIISDVYNIAGKQIVSLQSPTSTTMSSAVVEAIFIGVLASLMLTITVGMSFFVSLQKGGAGKICAAATAAGSAVLGSIKLFLPVLGPGPTIGALMGVAGAVGVSLSAAGIAIDQYRPVVGRFGWVGRLGVTVGAAVGAFLMSSTHGGLSGMFMCLCAAAIPPGAFLILFLHSTSIRIHLYLCLMPAVVLLFVFAGLFYTVPTDLRAASLGAFFMHAFAAFCFEYWWR